MLSFKDKLLGGLSLIALVVPVQATAQSSDKQDPDTIIVTVQRRAQSIQDVPASIAAFDARLIEEKRISSIEDIAEFTPSLYSNPNATDSGGLKVAIRGIGVEDPQIGQDARVAIYVDGVYMGKSQGLGFDMPDLARVEVLKGPQGTLYGRNSVAGAINLISEAPDTSEFSGKLDTSYGSYNESVIKGALNVPLTDKIAVRASGLFSHVDGWVENRGLGNDFGESDREALRAAIGYEHSEDLSFVLAADYTRSENSPYFYQAIPGTAQQFDGTATPVVRGAPLQNAITPRAGRAEDVSTDSYIGSGTTENLGVTLVTDYDWADNRDAKLTLAYRSADSDRFISLFPEATAAGLDAAYNVPSSVVLGIPISLSAGTALIPAANQAAALALLNQQYTSALMTEPNGIPALDGHKQYSADLTFTGDMADGALEYTAGLYYFDEDTSNDRGDPAPPKLNDLAEALQLFGLLEAGLGDNTINSTTSQLDIRTKAMAAYTQWTLHATDELRFTGGLRWSEEDRKARLRPVSLLFADRTSIDGTPLVTKNRKVGSSRVDPAFIVEYDVTDNAMVYGSYKESFRSGGFNQAAYGEDDLVFGDEEITAYEVGLKSDTDDRKIRFNASAYYYDFKDRQVAVTRPGELPRFYFNSDQNLWGAEFDTSIKLYDNLTLTGGYAWADGEADTIVDPYRLANDTSDDRVLPQTIAQMPENSYNLGINYDREVDEKVNMFSSLNYSHRDETDVTSGVPVTDRDLVSGRIGLKFDMGNGAEGKVALWGENLTDDIYTIERIDQLNSFGYGVQIFGKPRTMGISAGVEF